MNKETYDFDEILKNELMNLIKEPYPEEVKKEKYEKLKPLIEEYQRQKEQLNNNIVYQGLTSDSKIRKNTLRSENKNKTSQAILHYQAQAVFCKKDDIQENKVKQEDVIISQTVQEPEENEYGEVQGVEDEIYNEFERELRNFKNYTRENKSYRYNKNGYNIGYKRAVEALLDKV